MPITMGRSRAKFLTYQGKIFDMMDSGQDSCSARVIFGRGEGNR